MIEENLIRLLCLATGGLGMFFWLAISKKEK